MNIIQNTPDFNVELTFEFTKGEKVTPKDVAMIADKLCKKCDENTTVLGKFQVADEPFNEEHQIGVRQSDAGFSPRENSNVGVFIVQNGSWWSKHYRHPDGEQRGHTISSSVDLDVIESVLQDYTHLYSVSVRNYSNAGPTYVSLNNDDIMPTIRKEWDDYTYSIKDDEDADYDYYELKMIDAFKKTLEWFDENDMFYGIIESEWNACVGTDINDETAAEMYESASSGVKEYDQYLNEPQYGTTQENDLDDWSYGYYNDEYGVVSQIITQCIRPMHDAGLIEYVGGNK